MGMLRNLPAQLTRESLLEVLSFMGFGGRVDFVYVPIDFRTLMGEGFAFVNLLTTSDAKSLMQALKGFSSWPVPSCKVMSTSWSKLQGFAGHVARYRNSPLMHASVPDTYRPAIYQEGVQMPFPPPTKKIKPP